MILLRQKIFGAGHLTRLAGNGYELEAFGGLYDRTRDQLKNIKAGRITPKRQEIIDRAIKNRAEIIAELRTTGKAGAKTIEHDLKYVNTFKGIVKDGIKKVSRK